MSGIKVPRMQAVTGKMSMKGVKRTPAKTGQLVSPAVSSKKLK
jgi:hypothetical protein